jgi:hypothetical protein
MKSSPKDIAIKIEKMENAWEELAKTKSFGSLTLEEFKAITAPCKAARARLADLEAQMTRPKMIATPPTQFFWTRRNA